MSLGGRGLGTTVIAGQPPVSGVFYEAGAFTLSDDESSPVPTMHAVEAATFAITDSETARNVTFVFPTYGNAPPVKNPPVRQGGGNPGLNSIGYGGMLMNAVQTDVNASNGSTQSFTSGSSQAIAFPTVNTDPISEWDATSSVWTAQQQGIYVVRNNFAFTTLPSSFSFGWSVLVNSAVKSTTTEVTQDFDTSLVLSLNAGDTVSFALDPNAAVTMASGAYATIVRTR